jgi:predicted PurR-regulated permease PerM
MNTPLRSAASAVWLAIGLGWLLHVGQSVLVPVVFGILIAYVTDALARLLMRIPVVGGHLRGGSAHLAAALAIALVLAILASQLAQSLGQVTASAPQYAAALLNTIQEWAARLGMETTPTWESLRQDLLARVNAQRLIGSTVVSVTGMAWVLVVVALYVALLLVERGAIKTKLAGLSRDPGQIERIQRVFDNITDRVGTYLLLKTAVSAVQGLLCYAILRSFGVDLAGFWAVLVGLLNFVPYIGSVLGVFLPGAFAAVQLTDMNSLLALLLALSAAQFAIGFFLDPYVMGKSLNLSPFIILVSLAAWGSLWGMAGAFLAVPLMACLALVLAEFEETRPLAVLLSRDGAV